MKMTSLRGGDPTWRFRGRDKAKGGYGIIDGQECYWFDRDGGDKPTDKYTTCIIPVDRFWRNP